ncbi:MAG TPA: ATP-binding protein [Devosiaceae bacterium]
MKARSDSITRRLVVALTLGTTVLWLIAAAVSSGVLRHELDESFDRALTETARRLLPLAAVGLQDADAEADGREIHHIEKEHGEGLVYQLRNPSGGIVLRSDDAPAEPFNTASQSGFSETDTYRLYTLYDPTTKLAIQVGEPLAHRQSAIMRSTLTLFLPLLLLVPLSIAGIFFAIRRGLRPLTDLQQQISARDAANLAPLSVEGLPNELAPIGDALSSLIDRLRAALDSERAFAANSAHELRTPIAGALAQTQRLIAGSDDDAVRTEGRRIEATLKRLAELAEKLIQLSRADAGMAASDMSVEILPVLRLVVADARGRARPARDIEVAVAPDAEHATARINVDALAIVLRNLVDNAVAHGAPGTPVVVRIDADRTISVRNECPLVPAETMERLRRRFERGPTASAGSGLGLAIVETILKQTGATLELRSPASGWTDGFEAIVRFKDAPPAAEGAAD